MRVASNPFYIEVALRGSFEAVLAMRYCCPLLG